MVEEIWPKKMGAVSPARLRLSRSGYLGRKGDVTSDEKNEAREAARDNVAAVVCVTLMVLARLECSS